MIVKKINNSIQLQNSKIYYVIIIWKDGCWKYIAKQYGHKFSFNCSTKMTKAKRFDSIELAEKFIDLNKLHNKKYNICSMYCNYVVEFNNIL